MQREQIETILDNMGVPLNLNGYKYLVDAVLELNKNPFLPTGRLYEIVAENNLKSKSQVERSIRTVHQKTNTTIKEYLKLNCRINNGVLIKGIYRKVKRNEEVYERNNVDFKDHANRTNDK